VLPARAQSYDERPRLRGVIHLIAFCLTPALAATMIALAAVENGRAAVGASIYCASMSALFGVSALYHRRRWSDRGWQVMRRLDHATIFVFIAGTYTALGLVALEGARRWWVLGLVWAGCFLGVVLKLRWPHAPRWVGVPIYLTVGWVAVAVLGDIATNAGVAALVLLLLGGVFYSLGGVAYATHRPDPKPGTFGYHEVFHLLTVIAAVCQYVAVFLAIYHSPLV
jgi:hemolysin III